ncbi:chorismate-binding protein [uncultured Croceitalea sp.]|uniref:chorismate-binding protein n=1 Tax=uncultured Croceitalea sp. TaxID=1798908 RepID=UPI003305D522
MKQGLPFVLYRHPNTDKVKGVFQADTKLYTSIDFTTSGFLFAPFHNASENIVLSADECLKADFKAISKLSYSDIVADDIGEQAHLNLVAKAIQTIKNGALRKVIVSRCIQVKRKVAALSVFSRALANYENAFCYIWHHPKVGTWLGATPEQLLRIDNNQLYTTALAGTLPFQEGEQPNWTEKELEEQQMVTDFLIAQLGKDLTSIQVSKVKSVMAGQLWHLKTDISGLLRAKSSLKQIIEKIHPTSAVCGLPKEEAKTFILNNEHYDRQFYTGFLGELNIEQKSSLYVNLRCMQVQPSGVSVYVGGGITAGSNVNDEWTETQNKSRTMLRLL